MQRFKDKMKEIERQEELIQKKKILLDQKILGQKLLEQQKAMTSTETQSSSEKNTFEGVYEPHNRNQSFSGPNQTNAMAKANAFSNDGSFLKAFQLLQQKPGPSSSAANVDTAHSAASAKPTSDPVGDQVHSELSNPDSNEAYEEYDFQGSDSAIERHQNFAPPHPGLPPPPDAGFMRGSQLQMPTGPPPPQFQQQQQQHDQHQQFHQQPYHQSRMPNFPPEQAFAQFGGMPPFTGMNGAPFPNQMHPSQYLPFPRPPNNWPVQMPGGFPPGFNHPGAPQMNVPFPQARFSVPGFGGFVPLPPPPPPPPPPADIPAPKQLPQQSQNLQPSVQSVPFQLKEEKEEYDPFRPTEDSDNEDDNTNVKLEPFPVSSSHHVIKEAAKSPVIDPSSPRSSMKNIRLDLQTEKLNKSRKSRWAQRDEERSRSRSRSSSRESSPSNQISSAPSPRRVAEMIAKSLAANMPTDSVPSSSSKVPCAYVHKFTGGEMSADQLKQLKEQQQLMAMEEYIRARQNAQRAALAMKMGGLKEPMAKMPKRTNRHAYDSDEDIDDEEGTWEHKARRAEMDATKDWAVSLDEMSHGKHHLGDFLPPEELKKFTETFQALKEGRTPKTSDYEQFKLTCENVGFQMLTKLGWKEGEGLGSSGQGIVEPVGKGAGFLGDGSHVVVQQPAPSTVGTQPGATGATAPLPNDYQLSAEDDEFDAYRKRMMLAYRFRPNPLNNPRRPYY